ncbi:MAG TPA: O-antigen ligase family protein [Gemmatimonadales bacterium]|nr:O-antigen ligase family protein [Gemmatimonadales bacterium]
MTVARTFPQDQPGPPGRPGRLGRLSRTGVAGGVRWDLVMVALAGSLLTLVWRLQDLFPILAQIQTPTLAAVGALMSYAVTKERSRQLKTIRHPITSLALGIFVWMLFSIPGGVYPGLSFGFIFKDFIKTLLMFIIIAASIRSVLDAERLVKVHIAGCMIYALYVLAKVQIGSDGRFGELFYYDANGLGLILATTLPLVVFYTRPGVALRWRLAAVAACGIIVLTLMKTGSRGAFLALLATGLFLLFGFRAIPTKIRVGSIAIVAVLFLAVGSDKYWEMMGTLLHPENDYNWSGKNETGRMEVWKRGIGYTMAYPIFGVGADAFPIAEGTISPLADRQSVGIGVKWSAAHNSFVQIAAELGVPGFVMFLLILYNIFKTLVIVARRARQPGGRGGGDPGTHIEDAALAQVLMASTVAYMVAGFFLSEAYSPFLFSLMGIVVGLSKAYSRPTAAGAPAPGQGRPSAGWRAARMLPPQ